jgi:hypothetical protein
MLYFDLQVIEEALQVKTQTRIGSSAVRRISLGFKQLARALHAGAVARQTVAVGRLPVAPSSA